MDHIHRIEQKCDEHESENIFQNEIDNFPKIKENFI